jgi:hypothetical protein
MNRSRSRFPRILDRGDAVVEERGLDALLPGGALVDEGPLDSDRACLSSGHSLKHLNRANSTAPPSRLIFGAATSRVDNRRFMK